MNENQLIGARTPIRAPIAPEPETRREREAWASLAPSTRRRYRGAINKLSAYAEQRHQDGSAAASGAEELIDFMEAEAAAGRAGGLHIVVAALSFWQANRGLPVTGKDPMVRQALKRLKKQAAPPRQADGLGERELALIRKTARYARTSRFGRRETDEQRKLRAYTDIALVELISDAGLRRSEAARLTWQDLVEWEDGSGRLRIAPSKHETEEKIVYVSPEAMDAVGMMKLMQGWHDEGRRADQRLFRMQAAQIGRRVKQACAAAGLSGRYSGHSGRVGMAQRMTRAGASLQVVMQQGRWKSANMPSYYIRNEVAGEAAPYLRRSRAGAADSPPKRE